jgi:DNA-binding response OmpR family regulator
MSTRILYTEDELSLAEIVKESLESKGFTVEHAGDLATAEQLYRQHPPDLILLDVMLPDGEGYALAKRIRMTDRQTPILFLTSKALPQNVVEGFESGGNDYLKKPFSIDELIVRMRVLLTPQRLLHTAEPPGEKPIPIGHFIFDMHKHLLIDAVHRVTALTGREAELLHCLCLHQNRIVPREALLKAIWGSDDFFAGRSLDVFITKLRKLLRSDGSVQILNIRGVGYKLVC